MTALTPVELSEPPIDSPETTEMEEALRTMMMSLTAGGPEIDEAIMTGCERQYEMFEFYDFFQAVTGSSEIWDSHEINAMETSSMFRDAGDMLGGLLHNPTTEMIGAQDLTLSDIYHAFNDAIEAVGDFGSVKANVRSLLVLVKHTFNKLSDEKCILTEDLMGAIYSIGDLESQMAVFKSKPFKKAFVRYFKVIFG